MEGKNIHICIILENTHENLIKGFNVGGIENQIAQLIKFYEIIDKIKISIITKYSEFKNSKTLKIYKVKKLKNFLLDKINFFISSIIIIKKINKTEEITFLNIHHYSYLILITLISKYIFKKKILLKMPIDFSGFKQEIKLKSNNLLISKIFNLIWIEIFKFILLKKISYIRTINRKMFLDLVSLKYPKRRILIIPNGIDIKPFLKILKKNRTNRIFGFVGRLEKFKNIRLLLEVFKRYLDFYPEDKLNIYGKGSEESYIKSFIKQKGLQNSIRWYGFEKDKQKIYSNIDVLIDPALAQGISNSNLEAMLSSTFLIASNVEGNKDLIIDNSTGLLFNLNIKDELLNKMILYRENQINVEKILSNAKREVLNKYDINKISKKIYQFLSNEL